MVPKTSPSLEEAMNMQLEEKAQSLINKIKHYLITTMGVTVDEATNEEFYRAFSMTLREEIMINWTATSHTYRKQKAKMLYFLCMEYLPGRILSHNITNTNSLPLIQMVMKKMNKNYKVELECEREPGLGNGGLGRLAACYLDSLATQQYPAVAFGLRYQYGTFDQEIWDGVQVERPDPWLLYDNPHEFRRDNNAFSVQYTGNTSKAVNKKGIEYLDIADFEEVRALSYDIPFIGYRETLDFNVCTLRLWTTKESPRNFQLQRFNAGQLDQASENTLLTDVLYPNDNNETGKRIRLKQEFLLVSASVQDIFAHYFNKFSDMSSFADKIRIQINDTHPALVIAELMRVLIKDYDFDWGQALEVVRTCCSYTNHTIMKEALEEWNVSRMQYLLPRQYHIIERLNLELCNAVRQKYPGDEERVRRMSMIENGQVKMANLAIYGSHKVNGVAKLHSEILKKEIFPDFNEMFPDKFTNVTNGVTPRRWVLDANPLLAEFINKRIGRGWITDFPQIAKLADFASDPETQKEFIAIKRENKKNLIQFLKEHDPIRDYRGADIGHYTPLDETALFDVQVKRIHEYKRQLMNALHIIMLYHEIKANPAARQVKRQFIFAGKAAPGYELAKNIIRLICCIARKIDKDPVVSQHIKVAFIEDYNVSKAEIIIPAADLSEQISTAGMEASGTSNMKLAINGALTIGTEDGANIEMHEHIGDAWWPFKFGKSAEENVKALSEHSYNPWSVYMHDQAIKEAVDSLRDHSFAENEIEHTAISSIYHYLLESQYANTPDHYFTLNDLRDYYETQKKVEALYLQPNKWAEFAIHNIAGMGSFSSDEAIHDYAKNIWGLQTCPVDKKELEKVRAEYSEHDKCRIF